MPKISFAVLARRQKLEPEYSTHRFACNPQVHWFRQLNLPRNKFIILPRLQFPKPVFITKLGVSAVCCIILKPMREGLWPTCVLDAVISALRANPPSTYERQSVILLICRLTSNFLEIFPVFHLKIKSCPVFDILKEFLCLAPAFFSLQISFAFTSDILRDIPTPWAKCFNSSLFE